MALLEMLRKATADGDTDFLREGVRLLAQAVMEAEATELTGLAEGERDPDRRLTHRNGYRDRAGTPASRRSASPCPGSATARTSPPCSIRAGAPSASCSRSSRKRTSRGSASVGWTTSSGPWGSRGSAGARCPGCAPRSTRRSRRSAPVGSTRSRTRTSGSAPYLRVGEGGHVVSMGALVAVGGRGERGAPRALPGAVDRQRRGVRLAPVHPISSDCSSSAVCGVSASSSATATPVSSRPSPSSSSAPPGSGAGSI